MQEQEVARKLELCVGSFKKVLYEPDDIFLKNMEKNNLAGDDISKYQLWEWTQGVGLYGLYNYYKLTGDRGTFDFLCGWYDARMAEGLPERNVNTTCPMLTLLCVYEDTQDERYGALCRDWAEWVMHGLIRTGDGAFQHMITGDANDSQMLIDTLFMTVLFLANKMPTAYPQDKKSQS